jgi:aminopeptidase-like protein
MKQIIETLSKFGIQLLGSSYDNAIEYLKSLIELDVIDIPSGTELGTWTVPDEWVAKEAWVKFNGEKIIEYKNDLSLMVYSAPFQGMVNRDELKKHLYINKERPDAIPYEYSFYEKKWGFCLPANKVFDAEGKDLLPEGEYEVFVDTEFKPGVMKIGVHTIKGKTDKEILLFAHLDHPYQANDNLSGVACLTDLAHRIKDKYNHTIKIVFCPETIGSIGYALTQDISKVDFMIAVDICGNDGDPTVQWAFEDTSRLNKIAHLALMEGEESFNMNRFRASIGSDEYVFNDPEIGIPGLLITRHPYDQYHTSEDTIDIISEEKIKLTQNLIENIIRIYEEDFIPVRKFKAPLFRSKYKVQTPVKDINLTLDYFIYNINGERWLSEITDLSRMNWRFATDLINKLKEDELVINSLSDTCKGEKCKITRKKS